jgi:hypothetical protein
MTWNWQMVCFLPKSILLLLTFPLYAAGKVSFCALLEDQASQMALNDGDAAAK